MGNMVCVSCRACPEVKGSVTSGSLEHYQRRVSDIQQEENNVTAPGGPTASSEAETTTSGKQAKQTADSSICAINICFTSPDRSTTPNGIQSTWDSYLSPELQACISNNETENCELSDVEKVAKGIVDVNIFITSQVIMPALDRYRLEMEQEREQMDVMRRMDDDNDSSDNDNDFNSKVNNSRNKTISTADKRSSDRDDMTIRVDNGAGIYLVDTVTMY